MRPWARMVLTIPAVMMVSAAWALGVWAIEPGAPERLIGPEEAVGITVRKMIAAEAPAADPYARKVQEALADFYAARDNRPLWVDRNGFTEKARRAMAELARADDYGLDARAYALDGLALIALEKAAPDKADPDKAAPDKGERKKDNPDGGKAVVRQASAPSGGAHAGGTDSGGAASVVASAGSDDNAVRGEQPGAMAEPEAALSTKVLAEAELALSRAVLTYAYHARGGRVDPRKLSKYLDRGPRPPDPGEVMLAIDESEDPALVLRGFHPKHEQFERLRQHYLRLRGKLAEKHEEVHIPPGPALREGDIHPHVALLRRRLGVPVRLNHGAPVIRPELYDEKLARAVRAFQKARGLKADGVVGSGTRRALNRNDGDRVQRILVNMERWRWMPENLEGQAGQYVWVNIPEFRVRLVRAGKVLFNQRVVVGKVTNQTPVFSDEMEWVELHPVWYVPNSIKVKEILPYLRRSTRILERQNLRMKCPRGVGPTPGGFGYGGGFRGDIRLCAFEQPPGPKNVLGYFKFKFPNKHQVYLHDTPQRYLFSRSVRTYSHGCVRVENPQRLAELILGKDQGLSPRRIDAIVKGPRITQQKYLKTRLPVHITYFTARVTDDGKLRFYGDYYGHDRRIAAALFGKGVALAHGGPAPTPRAPTRVAGNRASGGGDVGRWSRSVFNDDR